MCVCSAYTITCAYLLNFFFFSLLLLLFSPQFNKQYKLRSERIRQAEVAAPNRDQLCMYVCPMWLICSSSSFLLCYSSYIMSKYNIFGPAPLRTVHEMPSHIHLLFTACICLVCECVNVCTVRFVYSIAIFWPQ